MTPQPTTAWLIDGSIRIQREPSNAGSGGRFVDSWLLPSEPDLSELDLSVLADGSLREHGWTRASAWTAHGLGLVATVHRVSNDQPPVPELRRTVEHSPGDRYPHEIEWTASGTWTIPHLALGRRTGRTPAPGEDEAYQRVSGGRISPDELNFTVVGQAADLGWKKPPQSIGFLEDSGAQLEWMPLNGTRPSLRTTADSDQLRRIALDALQWLNDTIAPEGREFRLEDALYLVEQDQPKPPPTST